MFTPFLDAIITPGKRTQVLTIVSKERLLIAKRQNALVDATASSSDSNPHFEIRLTLWNTEEDADMYAASPEYTSALDELRPSIKPLKLRVFDVDLPTFHTIMSAAD